MKRLVLSLLSSLVLLSGCGQTTTQQVTYAIEDNLAFNEFMDQEFTDTMMDSLINTHLTLEHPENYGIDITKIDSAWGKGFSSSELDQAKQVLEDRYDQFLTFDYSSLSRNQQDVYDTYDFIARINIKSNDEKYDYYNQLFSSISGVHSSISTIFQDFRVNDLDDIDVMIRLANELPIYIQSALDYTIIQAEKGLLMTDIDAVVNSCNAILNDDTNPLLTSMLAKLDQFELNSSDYESYKAKIDEAYTNGIQVAYQLIVDTLPTLKSNNNTMGYAAFENGAQFYEMLVQYTIGQELTIKEIEKYLEEKEDEISEELINLIRYNPDPTEIVNYLQSGELPTFPFENYQQILTYNKSRMNEYLPGINDIDYMISDLPESLVTDGVLAYYMLPTVDGNETQIMRVNPFGVDIQSIETFETISHEGYPGHMYQFNYMYEHRDSLWLTQCVSMQSNSEGYGRYAQYLALLHLDEISDEFAKFYTYSNLFSAIQTLKMDIYIHYYGYSIGDIQTYLEENGFVSSMEVVNLIYKQLQANPSIFFAYDYGLLQILDLKEYAQDQLNDEYDEIGFNTALLDASNCCYSVVKRYVDEYIQSKK